MTTPGAAAAQLHGLVDEFFERDRPAFGDDLAPYSGHVHRVVGLIALQVPLTEELVRPVAVAGYYHDVGIWLDKTWDYLPPSRRRALVELSEAEQEHAPVVDAMIDEHHRVRRSRHPHPLVEAMRRADAADVYRVALPPGVRRADYQELLRRFPDAGLHRMLFAAFVRGVRQNPRKPAPMMRF